MYKRGNFPGHPSSSIPDVIDLTALEAESVSSRENAGAHFKDSGSADLVGNAVYVGEGVAQEKAASQCDKGVDTYNETDVSSPTDRDLLKADGYVKPIPTTWMRSAGAWRAPRSRNRRHQAKCGVTRSGTAIYHAHSLKARKVQTLLRLPGVL
ncbi:hypothetical protein PI124_g13417 [Phytophthora idaei]|nr:hypothetical protein PI125_g8630 [Phytophthora idaei]KAG3159558.1 hypothetical protein PI126_g7342 [Phytophthora idaei]KAG3241727.1 hypothetical protein PI124_g13417 [Phytophthora idaei]